MSEFIDWRQDGACRDEDPELHFPLGEGQAFAGQIAQAKAVCVGCPVLGKCREQGMREEFGIWGGLTESERRVMSAAAARLRERQVVAAGGFQFAAARPSAEKARELLEQAVADLIDQGATEITPSSLPAAFFTEVRKRSWVRAHLGVLADKGKLLLPTGRPGHYAVAAAASRVLRAVA